MASAEEPITEPIRRPKTFSGAVVSPAGDKFEGQWVNGKLQGQGTALYTNGDRYEGLWRDGFAEGKGAVFIRADGKNYEGDFKNGELVGNTMKVVAGKKKKGCCC